jgi:hypothetical protein
MSEPRNLLAISAVPFPKRKILTRQLVPSQSSHGSSMEIILECGHRHVRRATRAPRHQMGCKQCWQALAPKL